MKLPDKMYDVLKWFVILFIPGLASFYSGVAIVWNLPYVDEVPKTLMLLDTFLGAILGLSTINYNAEKKEQLKQAKVLNCQEDNK